MTVLFLLYVLQDKNLVLYLIPQAWIK